MHPPGAEKRLALRWHAIAETVRWPIPFGPEQQQQHWQSQQQRQQQRRQQRRQQQRSQQQQQQHSQHQQQHQPAAPTMQEATSACHRMPHGTAKAPASVRAPAAQRAGFTTRRDSPTSVLDMQF